MDTTVTTPDPTDALEAPVTATPAWTGLANPRRTRIWDLAEVA